jgi:hypothetical protein
MFRVMFNMLVIALDVLVIALAWPSPDEQIGDIAKVKSCC